jgi:ABC-type transport system involved in multi-copper enzyme maturation permease subunit
MNAYFDSARLLYNLSKMEFKKNFFTMRMAVLLPILSLFIVGSSWGFSDKDANLPADVSANTPFEVLFLSSLFILFSATLGIVLVGFDGISRKRNSGLLAIEFCQPTSRTMLGASQLLGVWLTVAIPTIILSFISIILVYKQMDSWPSVSEILLYFLATSLVLFWYASIQLLVSSFAKDMGSAVTLGVGTWLLFTMIWLLITVVLATILGVDATNTTDVTFASFSSKMDLFSPNGLYQLLLEAKLENNSRILPAWQLSIATICWTFLPSSFFIWKFNKLDA